MLFFKFYFAVVESLYSFDSLDSSNLEKLRFVKFLFGFFVNGDYGSELQTLFMSTWVPKGLGFTLDPLTEDEPSIFDCLAKPLISG